MTTVVNGVEMEAAAKPFRTYTTTLPCRLTDEELLACWQSLGAVLEEIDEQGAREEAVKKELKAKMSELKAKMSELKAKMSELESRRTGLAIKLRRREETRDVDVAVHLLDNGLAQEVRTDTGEVLKTRPLTDREKQMTLPAVEALPPVTESAPA